MLKGKLSSEASLVKMPQIELRFAVTNMTNKLKTIILLKINIGSSGLGTKKNGAKILQTSNEAIGLSRRKKEMLRGGQACAVD